MKGPIRSDCHPIRRLIVCTAALGLVLLTTVLHGQGAVLRYKWTKGDQLRYRIVQQGTTSVSGIPGLGDMTTEQIATQTMLMVVNDVAADGSATIRQTFESVRFEINAPTGKVVVDSARPSETSGDQFGQILASIISAMIGESLTVTTASSGELNKVQGMSAILEKMVARLPPNASAASLANGLKTNFSDDAMTSMLSQGFAQFPERALKTGETWDRSYSVANPIAGQVNVVSNFTFQGVDASGSAQLARVTIKSTISPVRPGGGVVNQGPMRIQMGNATSDTEVVFDVARGRLQRSTTRSSTPGTMLMPAPDGTQMSLQMLSNATVTMELVAQ